MDPSADLDSIPRTKLDASGRSTRGNSNRNHQTDTYRYSDGHRNPFRNARGNVYTNSITYTNRGADWYSD